MADEKILMIEDDSDISELVEYNLQKEGFEVHTFGDGREGLDQVEALRPSIIVLDLMLPGLDGLTVCRKLRAAEATRDVPIIMLTAKSEESDVVIGLELGADDYVTKPFSPKELVARIRAILRRRRSESESTEETSTRREIDPIVLDTERHEVFVEGEPLSLTLAEYRLLDTLTSRPGRVFTREQILDKITGGEAYVIDRNVDVHVRALRKKLGNHSDFIVTVRGVGYKCRG